MFAIRLSELGNYIDIPTFMFIIIVVIAVLGVSGILRDFGKGFVIAFSKKKYSATEAIRAESSMSVAIKVNWLAGVMLMAMNVIHMLKGLDFLYGEVAWRIGVYLSLCLISTLYSTLIHIVLIAIKGRIERKAFLQKQIVKVDELPFDKYELTDRETEVAQLVIEGASNKEIAETLFISVNTVKKHLSNVFEKMEVENREEMKKTVLEVGSNIE